jgi:hypothetical protein
MPKDKRTGSKRRDFSSPEKQKRRFHHTRGSYRIPNLELWKPPETNGKKVRKKN